VDAESKPRRNIRSAIHVSVMVAAGLVVALVVGFLGYWMYAAVVGWAVACLVYVVWVWAIVWRMGPNETREHALREDP
jgi:uncharacterized membrane protein